MTCDESITDFIGERWREKFNKKNVPKPTSLAYNKVLAPIWEGTVSFTYIFFTFFWL
jgi:hypothetical protein